MRLTSAFEVFWDRSLTRKTCRDGGETDCKTQSGLMVLVDTSVWIRSLAGRAPYTAELDSLLGRDEVAGHELVYGELLIGDRGGRGRLLAAYERIHQAASIPHRDVVAFARARRLYGRGLGWIDVHLLASAVVERLHLWTADSRFATVARELRVSYR
ncbi:Ribonuclease VapC32 (modular protein) [Candidatus Sulfopaludibacter sp. SbA3]|nr:Ribonuclease VapC32 (modular protein) [Candidatus Sulfopaludibacter sp. SbA3]